MQALIFHESFVGADGRCLDRLNANPSEENDNHNQSTAGGMWGASAK
jgi:hypothetical protein